MGRDKGKAASAFEELHVYERARELTNLVYRLTCQGPFARDRGLVDQIRRASVSIMSNIAEGFERGTTVEFVQFLYIAKGSAGEVRAQLQIARDQEYLSPDDYENLRSLSMQVSGMLSNFISQVQNSSYQGAKFSGPKRQAVQAQEERLEALRVIQEANIRASGRSAPSHEETEA